MTNELYVTLESSENSFLQYPCVGWLELFEIGRNGSIIKGVFRRDPLPESKEPGFSNCPVVVDHPIFKYDHNNVKFRKQFKEEFSV